jgi:hypothetical protein
MPVACCGAAVKLGKWLALDALSAALCCGSVQETLFLNRKDEEEDLGNAGVNSIRSLPGQDIRI